MKVLVAPDKFRGSLTVDEVVAAMTAGIRLALPEAEIECCPLADGGDGAGEIIALHLGAQPRTTTVRNPVGESVSARWWLTPDTKTAIIEMAEASGLRLIKDYQRDPLRTSTYGTGQLMRAALDAGAQRLLVGVGGSATIDGGSGALQALGWRFMRSGRGEIEQPLSGGDLANIASIAAPREKIAAQVSVLCDVDSPLLGEVGAVRMFGPQKGLKPGRITEFETGLKHLAYLLSPYLPVGATSLPGSGAAGGLPLGLLAAGASMQPGFEFIARQVKLRDRVGAADVVLTGEGRFDEQSLRGKVVGGVAGVASEVQTPVVAFVGAAAESARLTSYQRGQTLGLRDVVPITPPGTRLNDALTAAAENLTASVFNYFKAWEQASSS